MAHVFERAPSEPFGSLALLERTPAAHATIAWSSPSVSAELKAVLLARANFGEPVFSRHGDLFHYSFASPASAAYIVVISKVFAPEMLLTLSKVLLEVYVSSGKSVLAVQAAFLSAYISGTIPRGITAAGVLPPPGPGVDTMFTAAAFDASKNFRPTGAKALLAALGVEAILAWTALMTGKRVAVFGGTPAEVIKATRCLPLLVAHRFSGVVDGVGKASNTAASVMWPLVVLSEHPFLPADGGGAGDTASAAAKGNVNVLSFEGALGAAFVRALQQAREAQLADLAAAASGGSGFVAGFTDPAILQAGGTLWDACINLRDGTVTVAASAKTDLALGSVHKEVAKTLLEAVAAPDASDVSILSAVAGKTIQLVDRLRTFFPDGISMTDPGPYQAVLKAQGLPAGVERFLWAVATAEPSLRAAAPAAAAQ